MSARLRRLAVEIYSRGLERITPERLLREALRPEADRLELSFLGGRETVALAPGARIFLLAVGKAAAPMAAEAHRLLGGRIAEGLVVTKEGFSLPDLPYPTHEAGHPIPDGRGLAAAEAAQALLGRPRPGDVVLVLVSGGASALLPAPLPGISLADKQRLVEAMLRTEMDIHQINRVRKALSRFKGGGLAALAAPARVVGLLLSDVPGDDPASIGSGPTVPEPPDAAGAMALLREKGLWQRTPPAIQAVLERGSATATPQPAGSQPPVNGLIGANRHLLYAMRDQAAGARPGLAVEVEEAPITGGNGAALEHLLARWQAHRGKNPAQPCCLIAGGETVVAVTGQGKGGRCQELAALMLPRLEPGTVFLAAGSDGNDGPTDAAGGVVDRASWQKIAREGIPYRELLADNDSYRLLEASGNLIKVPPTRNNLMDVYLFLADGK